jgi:hypothetical protein
MSDLTPELQKLVLAGRVASQPTQADCTRVLQAFHSRLGVSVSDSTAMQGAARLLSGKAIGMAVAGFALLCAGVARLSLPQDSGAVTAVASAKDPAVASSVRDASPREDGPSAAPAISAVYATAPLSSAPSADDRQSKVESVATKRAPDQLSEEADILLRAEAELHAGRADSALKLLNEHERRFARGLLAEERTAATIQALCSLGRTADAAARLGRLSSASLHGERARQACGLPRKEKTNIATGSSPAGSTPTRH